MRMTTLNVSPWLTSALNAWLMSNLSNPVTVSSGVTMFPEPTRASDSASVHPANRTAATNMMARGENLPVIPFLLPSVVLPRPNGNPPIGLELRRLGIPR